MEHKEVEWRKFLKGKDNISQFVRGSGGSLLARSFASVVAFGSAMVLTNFLGTEEYGNYAYTIAWLTTLVLFGKFGFRMSAMRYLAMYQGQEKWSLLRGFLLYSRSTSYKISIGISILVGLSLIVLGPQIKAYYNDDGFYNSMLIAMIMLPFVAHLELNEGVLDGYKRVALSQVPMRLLRPALIALSLPVLYYVTTAWHTSGANGESYLTVESAMTINLIALLLSLGLSIILVRQSTPQEAKNVIPDREHKEWFSTSRDMMLTTGSYLLLVQSDVMILGALVGTESAGIYSIASRAASLLILALTAVNAILHPISADLFARKQIKELQRIVSLGANAVFVISVLGALTLFLFSDFLFLLFGEEFTQASPLLNVLILGQLTNAFAGPAVLLLNMTGHQRDSAKIMTGGAFLNLVLNFLLIGAFDMGAMGAAIATSTTTVIWNVAAAVFVWTRLNIVSVAFWRLNVKPSS